MPKISECSKEVQIAYEKYKRGEITAMEMEPWLLVKIHHILTEELEEKMRDYNELLKMVREHDLGM